MVLAPGHMSCTWTGAAHGQTGRELHMDRQGAAHGQTDRELHMDRQTGSCTWTDRQGTAYE